MGYQLHPAVYIGDDFKVYPKEDVIAIVKMFVNIVEKRAEENMLKTGKLEGAHYAAMKQLIKEYEA